MNKETEQFLIRIKKAEELNKNNINPFLNKFIEKNQIGDILKEYQNCCSSELELNKVFVSVSGRVILKRIQGKAGFLILQDFEDTIQIYANNKLVSEKAFWIFKNVDLGDIIGISGYLFKTKTNELTIKSNDVFHLSKSLRPLPDKHKGLKDKETIRKKRFLDLIINDKTRKIFLKRIKIIQMIRNFFHNRGFLEVETPILHSILGGAAAKPFITHHNALESDFYLRIATEIPLKKLIVGGIKAIFEIGRVFRNEGIDAHHNPEFTTIEAYLAYSDMQKMIHLTKDLLREVCQNVLDSLTFEYQQYQISFNKFYQYDMVDIIKQKTGVNFYEIFSLEDCLRIAREHHIVTESFYTKGHIIIAFFEKFVEETLIQPTFIYNYPLEVSPLAQVCPRNPEFVERFELFIAGKEFVNAFSELNDPIEQKKRFENQLLQKKLGNEEAEELDSDFIEALEYGMPPTGGMGLGIDRLVMLLTNTANIRDVILFPHFKQNKTIL